MKNKGLLTLISGALAIGFSTMSYSVPLGTDFVPTKVTKPASKHGLRLPDTPKGGPFPMCWPGITCE